MFLNRVLPALLPVLCNTALASAHGLFVRYDVQPPDQVVITGFWHADEPAADAQVRMLDPDGKLVAVGTTDEQGHCTFTATQPLTYSFEVTASGHRADCQLTPEAAALLGATNAAAQEGAGTNPLPPQGAAPDEHAHHHEGAAHSHADEHDPDADHTNPSRVVAAHGGQAEPWFGSGLVSGLALILAGAAFLMTLSLRREVQLLRDRSGRQGS
jgi:hypothetical protein